MRKSIKPIGASLGAIAVACGAVALAQQVSLSTDVNLPENSPEWKQHFAVDMIAERPAAPQPDLSDASRYDTMYKGRVAGFDIGRIHMTTDIGHQAYKVDYKIEQKGVARWFSETETDSLSVGTATNGALTSLFYQKLEEEDDGHQYVELVREGPKTRFSLWSDPQYDLYWPVPEAYGHDTVDPIAAQVALGMTPVGAGKDPCDRVVKVYDGKRRWNMISTRDGGNTLRSDNGYSGETIRCRISQKRVAGFKPEDMSEDIPDGFFYLAEIPEAAQNANFKYIPVRMEGNYGIITAKLEAHKPTVTGPDGTVYKMYD